MDPESNLCNVTEKFLAAALRRLTARDLAFVGALSQGLNQLPYLEAARRVRPALVKCCDAARSDPSAEGREAVEQFEQVLAIIDRTKLLLEADELTRMSQ